MKKRRCQGVLIENDMAQGDEDALVCCWCGTLQRRLSDVDADDRCLARFAAPLRTKVLGDVMSGVRVVAAHRGASAPHAKRGVADGRPRLRTAATGGRA